MHTYIARYLAAKRISVPGPDRGATVASFIRPVVILTVAAAMGLAAACGGGSPTVWAADATKMVAVDMGGGLVAPAPAGSTCVYTASGTYTFTTVDNKLAWHICRSTGAQLPNQYADGERVLSSGEATRLVDALSAVTISNNTRCGADKDSLQLKVTTAAGEKVYVDDFDACLKMGAYVSNIDQVFDVSSNLAN